VTKPGREEFYVGYLPHAPRVTARRMRRLTAALIICALLAATVFVLGQREFAASHFEFGQYREFEGVVRERPYPSLAVRRPGEVGGLPAFSEYLLVAAGKHGAAADVAGFDGRSVRLRGSLIYRDGMTMVEVVAGSVEAAGEAAGNATDEAKRRGAALAADLGAVTLAGEIVDSKCYLGVMNPGGTKPHRECAALCIRGGVPPLFVARDADGRAASLLLVSERGEPVNEAVLDFVAEPVEITGRVVREGEQLLLRADPQTYRRVN
jgi:hypothetical protein